jgi:hypothetical protein
MPVRVTIGGRPYRWLRPTEAWRTERLRTASGDEVLVDPSFYVTVKRVDERPVSTAGPRREFPDTGPRATLRKFLLPPD